MSARTRAHAALADNAVSLPIVAIMLGKRIATIYAMTRDGRLPLTSPSSKGKRRVALQTLAALGVDVSPERLVDAERLFDYEIVLRRVRRAREDRIAHVVAPASTDAEQSA